MPPPFPVKLVPHDPRWIGKAAEESRALATMISSCLRVIHHIGSTAIPNIRAKPIVDLMPVVTNLAALEALRGEIEALGYEWWGELGLPGRRYCSKIDPETGLRLVQLHCYAEGAPDIARHLAFGDFLLEHPAIAQDYDREKVRCQSLHPRDSHAYSDCKNGWIKRIEAEAMARYHRDGQWLRPTCGVR